MAGVFGCVAAAVGGAEMQECRGTSQLLRTHSSSQPNLLLMASRIGGWEKGRLGNGVDAIEKKNVSGVGTLQGTIRQMQPLR